VDENYCSDKSVETIADVTTKLSAENYVTIS